MKLSATQIDSEDYEMQLLSIGFYDEKQAYGVGLSQDELDKNRIELMVADQSVYELKNAQVLFTPEYFELALKKGTIKESDGQDFYQIYYDKLSEEKYNKMKLVFMELLKGRNDIIVKYS